jgi:ADP-heptose:LPS heptosyltransferase
MDLSHKRILIVKPSSLGDIVHTLPLVHAIKREYPDSYLGWIVQKGFAALIESDPSVDQVIRIFIPSTSDPYAGRAALARALKETLVTMSQLRKLFHPAPYDLVLDLHASFRSAILGRCNPRGLRIGFADAKELNSYFQDELVRPDPNKPHAMDKNLAFADHLEIVVNDEDFHIAPGARAAQEARDFLSSNGVSPGAPIIYANPAARWSSKRWSMDGWVKLGDALMDEDRMALIMCGSPDDLEYIGQIVSRMKRPPIVSAGKISLAAAISLAGLSHVYVGVDSGPMHFSAMAGAQVVALFGPTDPRLVGPYGKGHKVITRDSLECLACRKRNCESMECLHGIGWEEVYTAILELIHGRD